MDNGQSLNPALKLAIIREQDVGNMTLSVTVISVDENDGRVGDACVEISLQDETRKRVHVLTRQWIEEGSTVRLINLEQAYRLTVA